LIISTSICKDVDMLTCLLLIIFNIISFCPSPLLFVRKSEGRLCVMSHQRGKTRILLYSFTCYIEEKSLII
jgi:hypothetical protein